MIISIIRTIAFILFSIGLTAAFAEKSGRGKVIKLGNKVKISYTGSYALLIGESDYTASGWQDLNSRHYTDLNWNGFIAPWSEPESEIM